MKLIRCYIENFGKLSHFSYDFSDGLNVILQENGFGKTTFAAFIKAMFYGLSGTGKTSVLLNERKRYKPWQGGGFGGNLVFEQNGNRYLIERFFGEKDKDETFLLYNDVTGVESKDYTLNIGEELFSLDAQAFERSLFMPQLALTTAANDSLLAKLTGESQEEKDMGRYETAIGSLEKEKKELIKIGEKGRIWELRHQITKLQCEMQELTHLEENEEKYRQRLKEVQESLEAIAGKREELAKELELAGAYEKNQAVRKHFQALKQTYDAKKKDYEEELLLFPENIRENIPDQETFAHVFEQISLLQGVAEDVSVKSAQVDALYDSVKEAAKEKENAARRENEMAQNEQEVKSTSNTVYYAGALLLAAVAIGVLFVNGLAGCLLLGVSIVLLGMVWNHAKKQKQKIQKEQEKREQKKLLLREEYEAASTKYERKYDEWITVKKQQEEAAERKESLEGEIQKFIYGMQPETVADGKQFVTIVSEMKQHADRCRLLKAEMSKMQEEFQIFQQENAETLQQYMDKPVKDDIENVTPKSLSQIKQEDDACNHRQQQLVEERSQILRQLERFSQQLERGQEDQAQLEHAKLQLQELEERYNILDKTVQYLEKAKERFSVRYLDKIRENFQKYMEVLNEGVTMESALDTKLKLKITQSGSKKDVDCFSAGYKDLMYLCMRFALVDALCEQGDFLVLDDPFVNLDKGKIQQGLSFLKKLEHKYQIVYLTCHESRCVLP